MEPTNSQVLSEKLHTEKILTLAEIERLSRSIAEQKGNLDYYISPGAWEEIERGTTPSIYQLFSLAVCLQVPYERVMQAFGVDPFEANVRVELERTELVRINLRELGFAFELNLDHLDVRQTHLLNAESSAWHDLPGPLQERLNPSRYQYGWIGSEDDSMGDLIPPGSLVEIDRRQTALDGVAWKTLYERPVHMVRHLQGDIQRHSCAWCQQDGPELTLLPHPLSKTPVRRFVLPRQAEIIGRVVSVWLF